MHAQAHINTQTCASTTIISCQKKLPLLYVPIKPRKLHNHPLPVTIMKHNIR
jgi:hypothetical protein